jgi:hypothetical protein
VQKFTRPITREIEIGGERLALTFGEQGIAVRPVGSRKPPKEISWAGVLTHMIGPGADTHPSPEQITAAVEQLRGPGSKSASKPEHESAPESSQPSQPSTVSPSAPPP